MKLATFAWNGAARVGAVVGEEIVDLAYASGEAGFASTMLDLLAAGDEGLGRARSAADRGLEQRASGSVRALGEVTLLAPVARPGKIIGVGLNYKDHAAEVGRPQQDAPRLFVKVPSAVVGPGASVAIPDRVKKLDFEAELAVVIGKRTRGVAVADAVAHIAGYTVLNDLSAREFQLDVTPPQTSLAKSMDGFCPMGPWIVTRDEIGDANGLAVRTWVNDEMMQDGNTADLIFTVPVLVAYISRYMTLEPGDVIATGTPAGVGAFRKPPLFLKGGDRIRMEIERIGVLETTITQ